jgi:hypothetical protein
MLLTLLFFKTNIFNCPISNVYCVLPINAFKIITLALPFSNAQSGGNMCLVWTYICLACGELSVPKKEWKKESAVMTLVSEGPVWELWPGKILPTLAATLVILNTVETLQNNILFVFIVPGLTLQEEIYFLTCVSSWIGANKFYCNILNIVVLHLSLFPNILNNQTNVPHFSLFPYI